MFDTAKMPPYEITRERVAAARLHPSGIDPEYMLDAVDPGVPMPQFFALTLGHVWHRQVLIRRDAAVGRHYIARLHRGFVGLSGDPYFERAVQSIRDAVAFVTDEKESARALA